MTAIWHWAGAFARRFARVAAPGAALGVMVLAAACGGDEGAAEGAPGALGSGSPEERIAALEARAQDFQDFMVAQARAAAASGDEEGVDGALNGSGFEPYLLTYETATENERNIVTWMAECSAKGYLHPGLPEQVFSREAKEREAALWEGLANGQYSSFSFLIGLAFSFCEADLVSQ